MTLMERIENRSAKLAVWGSGYIGLSSALSFAEAGYQCLGVDLDRKLVDQLNSGAVPFMGFEEWIGLQLQPFVEAGRFRATTNLTAEELAQIDIHLVCVNTERNSQPYADALLAVLDQLKSLESTAEERLISIESTISPTWIGHHWLLRPEAPSAVGVAVAPRRDWFLRDGLNLRTVPRIVGATSVRGEGLARRLYSTICRRVVMASDWRHAALVKATENSLRYLGIVFANQLAVSFPDCDIAEVMRLAASKWNVPTYHPSLGIGGYCVPLAPLYLLRESGPGSDISLLEEAVRWDEEYPDRVLDFLLADDKDPKVGILGLSYAPDKAIYSRSPAVRLAQSLNQRGVPIGVHDPHLTREEIVGDFGLPWLHYPHELEGFSLILVCAGHSHYQNLAEHLSRLRRPPLVIDSLGDLKDRFLRAEVAYREMGERLGSLRRENPDTQAPPKWLS